jgi:ribosome-associated protein
VQPLPINETVTIPVGDLEWKAVASGGLGGQNVNKVASKVLLRFDLEGTTALRAEVKARLRALARGRIDGEGRLAITSQRTRDQERNLEDARGRLRDLILAALAPPPPPRRPTRPSRGAVRRRIEDKKRHGEKKRARGTLD